MATIRKATLTDMPIVLSIIQHGREKMIASGNSHQWGKLHPSDEQIKMDIEKENSYLVLSDEGSPIATFAFIEGVDSTYLEIEGKGWLNNEHYGTIHRIASVPNVHGILSIVIEYCFQKVKNIRIDTHEENFIMRKGLQKLGFTYCGVIHLENGEPRLAFQKTIDNSTRDMTEREKQEQGLPYNALDPEVLKGLSECEEECFYLNHLSPSKREERTERLRKLLGKTGNRFKIIQPFFCDYGFNIEIGEKFFANTNLVILDEAKVTFGDNVFIAPNCAFYTVGHAIDPDERNAEIQYAYPIKVGNNVWIGGNVVVLPGVTIGNNVVIGAGSVVTKNIPDNVVAVGNPCRVIKKIDVK